MPVFFSLHSDVVLSALCVTLLTAGVICAAISRNKELVQNAASWRCLAISLLILAFREWLSILGVSSSMPVMYYAVGCIFITLAGIPLLAAVRIDSPQRQRFRVLQVFSALTLAVLLGILLEPFILLTSYEQSGRPLITGTMFFLVKAFFCLTVLLFIHSTASGHLSGSGAVTSVLAVFAAYSFLMAISTPPGLPPSWSQSADSSLTMFLLYLLRMVIAGMLAAMVWNIYAKTKGVTGASRWWPIAVTALLLLSTFGIITLSQSSYQRAVRNSILSAAHNAAGSLPPEVLEQMASIPGSANNRRMNNELFARVRKLDFHIGYSSIDAQIDALAVRPGSGALTPVIDIGVPSHTGQWARGRTSNSDIWADVRQQGIVIRGLYSPRLVPVIAAAPVLTAGGTPAGAAVMTISAADLARDLYAFKRPVLLFLPLAYLALLLILTMQQGAWLSLYSTNRSEAMRLGILANDLAGILITRDDIVVGANQRVCEIVGMEREDLIGTDVSETFTTLGPGLEEETADLLREHGSALFEISVRRPDGEAAHIMVFGRKMSPDPEDKHFIWESVDISQIKEMETELRETRDYLQLIIDSLPVGVFTKDGSMRYRSVNQTFVTAMGMDSADEIIGRTCEEIRLPGWQESKLHDEICVDMRGSTLVYDQNMDVRGESRFFEVSKSVKWLGDDENNYVIIGCMHDFTTRKKVEDAITSERHFLIQLINTLPVIVCFLDSDRIIRLCDTKFCREAGVEDPEDLIGRPYDEVAPFGHSDPDEDIRILERGLGYSDKEYEQVKDGRQRNFILRRIVMTSSTGQVMGLVKAFWDTTALVAANHAAKNADRAKAAFLSNMSHELRTPMNGIVGMSDLIIEDESTRPVQRLYAETVIKSAKTLQMVIDEVMDIATLDGEDQRISLAEAPFPLLTLTEEATDIVSCIVGAWGISLRLTYDFSLSAMYAGDARRLRQILVQVLTHCSRLTADKRLQFCVEPSGTDSRGDRILFRCRFRRNGEVDAAGLEAMFKLRDKPDAGSQEKNKKKTSLSVFNDRIGLPLAWKLIQAMNGILQVQEADGVIDCRVFLPLRRTAASTAPTTAPDLSDVESIVALSEPELADDAVSCLLRARAAPVTVSDPGELRKVLAADVLPEKRHRLLLLDIRFMPREELYDFLQALEEQNPNRLRVALAVTPRDVQELPGIDFSIVSCLLLTPLCPSELWYKAERAIQDLTSRKGKARRSTRIARLVQIRAKVLLVEDNTVNQMVAMGILKKIGCTPVLAKNGAEAVEKIAAGGTFDVILMDCMMPIMDGYEATSRIRMYEKAHPDSARNIIIALTANNVQGDKEKCLASGMDDYITKPVTLEIVREALARHCPALVTMIDQAEGS